jgi:uncharacterized protein YpuA (DUF1002 family)
MKKFNKIATFSAAIVMLFFTTACYNSSNQNSKNTNDSTTITKDSSKSVQQEIKEDTTLKSESQTTNKVSANNSAKSTVLIYNFYITNRCVSCIAIEDATTKTLNTYFTKELKQGRIKRQILNVDDDANKTISEKYQAFGSGLFVTRVYKGKETTTDLTGDGFKYAKNKEEKFIGILKETLDNALKQ